MHRRQDAGVNEVIASILMVALVIVLAIIIGSIVFGVIVIQPKSAYIPPRVEVVNGTAGQQVISLYSRGGDQAFLQRGDGVQYALGIYLETQAGSSRVTPDPGVETFNPGQTLYIYYNGSLSSGPDYRATYNISKPSLSLPSGQLNLRIVDENAKLLVYKEGKTIGGGATTLPSPTQTPSCGTITGIKYNDLNGNGQRDAGEPGLPGWTIIAEYKAQSSWDFAASATTGPDGTYVLSGLRYSQSAEQYRISEVVKPDWTNTQPGDDYHRIVLNPAHCYATGINFGNQQV